MTAAHLNQQKTLPDTRLLARAWALENLPNDAAIAVDMPHLSPDLPMARGQVERLRARMKEIGHPRENYYRLLLASNKIPAKTFWLYRIKRTPLQLKDLEGRTERSYQAVDTVDPEAGAGAWARQGILFAIMSDYGPDLQEQWPRLGEELQRKSIELRRFEPRPGQIQGPYIRVYRLNRH